MIWQCFLGDTRTGGVQNLDGTRVLVDFNEFLMWLSGGIGLMTD